MSLLPLVDLDDLLGVDGESLVGVDHHTEEPGVGLSEQIHSLVQNLSQAVIDLRR